MIYKTGWPFIILCQLLSFVLIQLLLVQMRKQNQEQYLIDSCFQKQHWSEEDDKKLLFFRNANKQESWKNISRLLSENGIIGRSGKQCRERFHNHLQLSLNKGPWSDQEEKIFLQLYLRHGQHWAKISRQIPQRSDNCVKNKFYSGIKKGLTKINITLKKQNPRFKKIQIKKVIMIIKQLSKIAKQENNEQNAERLKIYTDIIKKCLRFSFQWASENYPEAIMIQEANFFQSSILEQLALLKKQPKKNKKQNIEGHHKIEQSKNTQEQERNKQQISFIQDDLDTSYLSLPSIQLKQKEQENNIWSELKYYTDQSYVDKSLSSLQVFSFPSFNNENDHIYI